MRQVDEITGSASGLPAPLKVARVITRLNVGGPSRHVHVLHDRLDKQRFQTTLFVGDTDLREGSLGFEALEKRVHQIPHLRRGLSFPDDISAYRHLSARLRELAPSIVHTHMAKAGALGRLAAKRALVPVTVHTFHGHVLQSYFSRLTNRAFLAVEKKLAKHTDALVAVSKSVRDELLGRGIGKSSQWHVIPLGLDLEPLMCRQPAAPETRRQIGLPESGPVVGIVGRLVPIKDHRAFLTMAGQIAFSRPEVTFVVAGDGELREQLEASVPSILQGRLHFVGWISDLPALYSALDVVVLTSRSEGTPVALIEAGAAAKPVVAMNVGGVAEVVKDGVTGLLTAPGSCEEVAARVSSLLDDPSFARRLGLAARPWVAENFSADALAKNIAELYENLARQKGVVTGPLT